MQEPQRLLQKIFCQGVLHFTVQAQVPLSWSSALLWKLENPQEADGYVKDFKTWYKLGLFLDYYGFFYCLTKENGNTAVSYLLEGSIIDLTKLQSLLAFGKFVFLLFFPLRKSLYLLREDMFAQSQFLWQSPMTPWHIQLFPMCKISFK